MSTAIPRRPTISTRSRRPSRLRGWNWVKCEEVVEQRPPTEVPLHRRHGVPPAREELLLLTKAQRASSARHRRRQVQRHDVQDRPRTRSPPSPSSLPLTTSRVATTSPPVADLLEHSQVGGQENALERDTNLVGHVPEGGGTIGLNLECGHPHRTLVPAAIASSSGRQRGPETPGELGPPVLAVSVGAFAFVLDGDEVAVGPLRGTPDRTTPPSTNAVYRHSSSSRRRCKLQPSRLP